MAYKADAARLAMRMVPHLLWIVLEWGVFVALAETGHLLLNRATYWSWLLQSIFYTLLYAGYMWDALRDATLLGGLLLVHGTVWVVAVLITVIIARDDGLLIRATTLAGGSIGMGVAVAMHALVHYVPALAVWLALSVYWCEARAVFRRVATRLPRWLGVVWACATIISPIFVIGAWDLIFDVHVIYRTTFSGFVTRALAPLAHSTHLEINSGALWAVGLPTALILNGSVFFLLVLPYTDHAGNGVVNAAASAARKVVQWRFY